MTRRYYVGGKLDQRALTTLAALERLHFASLDPAQQGETVRRLHAAGHSISYIVTNTGLGEELVLRILAGAHTRRIA